MLSNLTGLKFCCLVKGLSNKVINPKLHCSQHLQWTGQIWAERSFKSLEKRENSVYKHFVLIHLFSKLMSTSLELCWKPLLHDRNYDV